LDLLEIAGAETVYLDLPLAQARTPDLCTAAEAEGFSFSGLGPSFAPDGDVLTLQYLNEDLDLSQDGKEVDLPKSILLDRALCCQAPACLLLNNELFDLRSQPRLSHLLQLVCN